MWLIVGTRPDVHGTAWKAHAHWLLGQEDAALAARHGRGRRWRGPSATPTRGRGAGLCADHLPDLRADCPSSPGRRRAGRDLRPSRLRVLPRMGADPGRVVPRGRGGHRSWPGGVSTPSPRRARWPGCRTGCRCSPTYWSGRPAGRTPARLLDAAATGARDPHDDLWWLPEVLRRWAAHDGRDQAAGAAAGRGAPGRRARQRRARAALPRRPGRARRAVARWRPIGLTDRRQKTTGVASSPVACARPDRVRQNSTASIRRCSPPVPAANVPPAGPVSSRTNGRPCRGAQSATTFATMRPSCSAVSSRSRPVARQMSTRCSHGSRVWMTSNR